MDTTTLAALAVFAGLGAGVWLLLVAVIAPPTTSKRAVPFAMPTMNRRVQVALVVGVAVAILTRWPVAALAAVALVWAWPWLFGGGTTAAAAIDRLEALAGWTESLNDTIAGAIGLEEAIPATAGVAAPPLRPHVDRLVERLRAREPLPDALTRFADDLDDPSADLVAAALILNARLRGPGLRATLEALACSARDELDLRRKIEAGRRALRTGVKIIVGTTVGFVGALAGLNSAYLDPYDTATGQAVLVLVAAVFAVAFAWLRNLGTSTATPRLLTRAGGGGLR
ncbi:MAG: type II secretion system F family protein [Sporichthyaceae bacterium]